MVLLRIGVYGLPKKFSGVFVFYCYQLSIISIFHENGTELKKSLNTVYYETFEYRETPHEISCSCRHFGEACFLAVRE
jgi:hypothetical protein